MHLNYSLPADISEAENMWLHSHIPMVAGLRYWNSEYSNVSNKYLFDVILKKGQEDIIEAILARHGVADYTRVGKTGLVSCFPNH